MCTYHTSHFNEQSACVMQEDINLFHFRFFFLSFLRQYQLGCAMLSSSLMGNILVGRNQSQLFIIFLLEAFLLIRCVDLEVMSCLYSQRGIEII